MEILAGAMVAVGLVASLLIMTFRNVSTPPEGNVFTVLHVGFCLSVATLAIALIVLGIGTMRARRWAWLGRNDGRYLVGDPLDGMLELGADELAGKYRMDRFVIEVARSSGR